MANRLVFIGYISYLCDNKETRYTRPSYNYSSNSHNSGYTRNRGHNNKDIIDKGEGEVYICTGGSSRRYHRTPYCGGLNNCSREIIDITLEEAEKRGKTPCQRCY